MPRGVDTCKVQAEAEGRESSAAAGSGLRKLVGRPEGRGGDVQWSREAGSLGSSQAHSDPYTRRPEERGRTRTPTARR